MQAETKNRPNLKKKVSFSTHHQYYDIPRENSTFKMFNPRAKLDFDTMDMDDFGSDESFDIGIF
jgi:hypothetical protein